MKTFIKQSLLLFKEQYIIYSLQEYLLIEFIYPIFSLIFYVILVSFARKINNFEILILNNSFLLCGNICIFTLGITFEIEKYNGRLYNLFLSSRNMFIFILEKAFFPYIMSIITTILGLFFSYIIFNIRFSNINLIVFLVLVLTAMFSMVMFSLFISFFGLITNNLNFILNSSNFLIMIMSGVNFSTAIFPDFIEYISYIFPLKRIVRVSYMVFNKIDYNFLFINIFLEISLGIFYFILSLIFIGFLKNFAKKNDKIDFY